MIYPIFLPQAGCPFQCIYCNQRATVSSGHRERDILEFVESGLKTYTDHVHKSGCSGEIAFFGGTFTALSAPLIESILLKICSPVKQGIFTGVRFSTRPDCLGEPVIDLISKYPVTTIEIGVQSLSGSVLRESRRGYEADCVYDVFERLRGKGWRLGIQLMAGLPGDNREVFIGSVQRAIGINPDFFRFYPTIVIHDTVLAEFFRKGAYAPLSIDDAVDWMAEAYDMAIGAGIPVIRMGLQADPALEKQGVILAGPYHPAFGCLVKSQWWRNRVDGRIESSPEWAAGDISLMVSPNQVGDTIGHGKSNIRHWKERWGITVKVIGDAGVAGTDMVIERGRVLHNDRNR